jgi:hypothetical protein
VERRTVNLSAYPDLVVIDLGLRVNALRGIARFLGYWRDFESLERWPRSEPHRAYGGSS